MKETLYSCMHLLRRGRQWCSVGMVPALKHSESREGCRLSCDCYSGGNEQKTIKGLLTHIHTWSHADLQSSCRPPQSRFRNITAVPSWVTCTAPLCLFPHPMMGEVRVYLDECVCKVLSPVLPHKYIQRKSHLKIPIHLDNNSTL